MANHMADVAKMLGVELEEEFTIPDKAVILKITAKDGLMYKLEDNENWGYGASDLQDLLMGKLEIVKLPWKPKCGDLYYYPEVNGKRVQITSFEGYTTDLALIALRMCYRTEEEASECFAEDYKKLTGLEWK